jgi:DNA-binding GntR family transcriptional regulator
MGVMTIAEAWPAAGQVYTLVQRYEVAKGTVEKALGVLRDEGLVRTVPGRGVYVMPSKG